MNSLGLCVLKAVALHRGLCLISVWMYLFPCLASSPQTEPRMPRREQPWVPCSFLLVGISFHSFPPVTRFGVLLIRLASYKSYLCSSLGVPTTSGGQRAPWGVSGLAVGPLTCRGTSSRGRVSLSSLLSIFVIRGCCIRQLIFFSPMS